MASFDILSLFIGGCLGGLLAGLLGVGGGIIFVVILDYYLCKMGLPEALVVPAILANSLFAIFFSGISGSIKQYLQANFFPKDILLSAIPAAIASIGITHLINAGTWYTREKFTLFFILLLSFVAYRILRTTKRIPVAVLPEKSSPLLKMICGLFTGVVSAFSGIGGGVIMVPVFTEILHIRLKKATGISLGVITLMSLLTSTYSATVNHVDIQLPYTLGLLVFPVVLPMVAGTIIFAPVGVSLSSKLTDATIKWIFFGFISMVIVKMLVGIL